ncbi:RmlC-like cupin [Panus rudis PR-1116 ss-1]|nr:RmlC-like cupin [Panus rudis PR-1116 ss-1]
MRATLAVLLGLGVGAFAQGAATAASKVAAIKTAASQDAVFDILSNDSDFVFDFNTAKPVTGAAGQVIGSNAANFPALTNQGVSITIGRLGEACGMNTPHTHPRATEMLYLVNGSIQTGMLQENGARFVYNEVHANQAQVFTKGSIHYQQNMGCDPILFVAALSNEDPGVSSIAQRFFGLPPAFVAASLGDVGVEEVVGLEAAIPDNIALGTDECLKKCGITRGQQPTTQRQPRVAGNALPSNSSGSSN